MTLFPSVISSFSTKVNGQVIDALDVNNVQTEIVQVENVLGVAGNSSVLGTIITDLRSPASSGGGHTQAANTGGTGQTSYTKGDILVGQSQSVLSKLAVGTDGFALVADSTSSSGLKYQGVAGAIQIQNQQYTYARGSVVSASVIGVILNSPVSVLSDGMVVQVKFPVTNTTSIQALSFPYNASSVSARIKNPDGTNPIVGAIQASMVAGLIFDSVSSVFQIQEPYIPTYGTDTTKFLRNDGTFSTVNSGLVIKSDTTQVNDNTATDYLSVTVAGGTLGTAKGIRGRLTITNLNMATNNDMTFKLTYGSTILATATLTVNSMTSQTGFIEFQLFANGATNAQTGVINAYIAIPNTGVIADRYAQATGTAAEDSTVNKTFKITIQNSVTPNTSFTVGYGYAEIFG